MCQEPIKPIKRPGLLPILMISDKFKWKSDGGLIKPRQRKVEISFIFSPSICSLLSNLFIKH